MTLEILANNLLIIRNSLGLTRQQIEKQCGISSHTIKAWENGNSEPGFIKLTAYLKYFENYNIYVTIDNLLEPYVTIDNMLEPPTTCDLFIQNTSSSDHKDIQQLFSSTTDRALELLLEEKEIMLQALLDYSPFKIYLKGENNNIIRINNLAAECFGGNKYDFEQKNSYDLFPLHEAKLYHKHDLGALNSNKPITLKYKLSPINSNMQKTIINQKTPIVTKNNNKILFCTVYECNQKQLKHDLKNISK